MDIRTMQYFLAVVREGTISAAAKALHVAQPSLSRQMRELEEELNAALFVRGNRRITLTEEGDSSLRPSWASCYRLQGCSPLLCRFPCAFKPEYHSHLQPGLQCLTAG